MGRIIWDLGPPRVLGLPSVVGAPRVMGPYMVLGLHRVLGLGSSQGLGSRCSRIPILSFKNRIIQNLMKKAVTISQFTLSY